MKYTEIEGVVLTPAALAQLKDLQRAKSERATDLVGDLDVMLDVLVDASRTGVFDSSESEVLNLVYLIQDIKNMLLSLKAPISHE